MVRYREVGGTLGEPAVILDRVGAADIHDGARVKFGPDRKLYVTMGDTPAPPTAQDLGALTGKILRLNDDGTVPGDNPFPGSPIFSYGHRNPQGLDWHAGDRRAVGLRARADRQRRDQPAAAGTQLRLAGDRGRPDAGRHGDADRVLLAVDRAVGDGVLHRHDDRPGSGSTCSSARSPGSTCCASGSTRTTRTGWPTTERLLAGRFGRIRDVVNGPDGSLYLCTSNRDGRNTPVAADDRLIKLSAVR